MESSIWRRGIKPTPTLKMPRDWPIARNRFLVIPASLTATLDSSTLQNVQKDQDRRSLPTCILASALQRPRTDTNHHVHCAHNRLFTYVVCCAELVPWLRRPQPLPCLNYPFLNSSMPSKGRWMVSQKTIGQWNARVWTSVVGDVSSLPLSLYSQGDSTILKQVRATSRR